MKRIVLAAVAICLLAASPSFACYGMCINNECRLMMGITNMSCSYWGTACIEHQENCIAAVAPEPEGRCNGRGACPLLL